MTVSTTTQPLADLDADLVGLLVADAEAIPGDAPEALRRAAADAAATGEPVLSYADDRRYAVTTFAGDDEPEAIRTAAAKLAVIARKLKAQRVTLALADFADEEQTGALVEGFVLGGYQFLDYKTGDDAPVSVDALAIRAGHDAEAAANAGLARAEAACFARDLVNLSPHDKTPVLLAERIEKPAMDCVLCALLPVSQKIAPEPRGPLIGAVCLERFRRADRSQNHLALPASSKKSGMAATISGRSRLISRR